MTEMAQNQENVIAFDNGLLTASAASSPRQRNCT